MCRSTAIWAVLAAVGPTVAADEERLSPLLIEVQRKELADRYHAAAERARIRQAGLSLGTWRRIGPFRDRPPHLNWMENVAPPDGRPRPANRPPDGCPGYCDAANRTVLSAYAITDKTKRVLRPQPA